MKTKKRQFSKGEISRPRMTARQRAAWKADEQKLVSANTAKTGDQHTRCVYCGRSYLITPELEGFGACAPCKYIVVWLPQSAKWVLDAMVYRLTALETLRQVHESEIQSCRGYLSNTLEERLKSIEKKVFRQKQYVRKGKPARRKKARR